MASCTLTKSTSFPVFSSSPVPLPRPDELNEQCRLPISFSHTTLMVKCSVSSTSSTSTATVETKKVVAKPKVPSKAPAKQLPQLMEEDVIPSLRATFEAQDDILDIQLTFQDNRLEGSFTKKDTCYSFWAFFPDGILTGARGFSLSSSYGSEVSTVEPFLVDEKKITAKHVVFWVEKRLAAQGILPVWLPKENDSQ